tara:strand:- start:3920 stop:4987 length:1068 start_codon:yes stop_codon:yes gene_type:complete
MSTTNRPSEAIKAEERASASDGGWVRFPEQPQPHSMLMVFETYAYDNFAGSYQEKITSPLSSLFSGGTRSSGLGIRSINSVELPFPKQLTDATSMIFNDMQQNPLIEGLALKLAAGLDAGSATLGDIPSQLQAGGAKIAAAMSGGGDVNAALSAMGAQIAGTGTADAAGATMYLLRKFMPEIVGNSINLAMGQTLNPRETIVFQGVELKTHTFSWDLYPSSAADSGRIQDIINMLKKNVLPTTRDLGSGPGVIKQAFLQYPSVCKMHLIGVDQEYFMKFKPAMVKSVTVDYGAGGTLAVMKGGRPAGVNIQITLQELQIETANDYGAVSLQPMNAQEPEELALNYVEPNPNVRTA